MYLPEPASARNPGKTGVLLVNLGTPDAPDVPSVRRYLAEFLRDPRVIELPAWKWWPILYGIILRRRPRASAEKYRLVWGKEGSPLRHHTAQQTALFRSALAETLSAAGASPDRVVVGYAMRYGTPSIASAIEALRQEGAGRLIVVPLYPQYAASTTGSTFDAIAQHLTHVRHVPGLTLIPHFYDHPAYVNAVKEQVEAFWQHEQRPDHLVFSFHGAPEQTHTDGDPYYVQCQQSARLLADALALTDQEWTLSFQSRFGRTRWLQPYTTDVLAQLAAQKKRVHVLCPSFVCDCLETLEEIGITEKEKFLAAGGSDYHVIPCPNESPAFIRALVAIVQPYLGKGNG